MDRLNQLNENPEISQLVPLTYSRVLNNIDTGKEKSKSNFFDLKKLVENFKLDIEINEDEIGYTKKPSLPAFISKSLNQSKPEFVYNYPPIGPIPEYFECVICEEIGPHYHDTNCTKPFESSLYLTEKGSRKLGKQEGASYKLVVKKRGQKKVFSTNAKNGRFTNNVILTYENENKSRTVVKIGKNGTINISSGNFDNKSIESDLVKKINKTGSLNEEEYNSSTFKIDNENSYTYMLFVQFNLYPKEYKKYLMNLEAVNLNLWETPLFKRKIKNKIYFVIKNKKYEIHDYLYNNGSVTTKSNKQSNPFIQFNIILDPFKVYVQIYNRGAVQLKMTYIDKKYENKASEPLDMDVLREVYSFLKQLFTILIQNSSETNYPIIGSEEEKERKGILNIVDGGQPKMCQNHKGRELRPVPFSFRGVCPMKDYYVRPMGVKRPDGKFEPCCYKMKKTGKDSLEEIQKRWREGFSEGIPDPDTLSAVYTPGTKVLESRRFKGLNDMTKEQLLDALEHFGYIGKGDSFTKGKKYYENLPFEHFGLLTENTSLENTLMISIPKETVRVLLYFDEHGNSFFINELHQNSTSGLPSIEELKQTVLDGYYDPDESLYYPFDILHFRGKDIMKETFKTRFDRLMYALDVIDNYPGSLTLSTNFDDSLENVTEEPESFILFIPLNSHYTPGIVNKKVKINFIENNIISLNVEHFRGNRWKISYKGKEINKFVLPQKENSVEIPVVFTNNKSVQDGDIVLFKINLNADNTINYNKPLIPIEKLSVHTMDLEYIHDLLEFIRKPVKLKELS